MRHRQHQQLARLFVMYVVQQNRRRRRR